MRRRAAVVLQAALRSRGAFVHSARPCAAWPRAPPRARRRVPVSLRPVFGAAADADRDALHSADDARAALAVYAARQGLGAGAGRLRLDGLLAGALFNKLEPEKEGSECAAADVGRRLLDRLTAFHRVSRRTEQARRAAGARARVLGLAGRFLKAGDHDGGSLAGRAGVRCCQRLARWPRLAGGAAAGVLGEGGLRARCRPALTASARRQGPVEVLQRGAVKPIQVSMQDRQVCRLRPRRTAQADRLPKHTWSRPVASPGHGAERCGPGAAGRPQAHHAHHPRRVLRHRPGWRPPPRPPVTPTPPRDGRGFACCLQPRRGTGSSVRPGRGSGRAATR